MKKYRDLKSYINDKWYDYIFKHVSDFIFINVWYSDISTNRIPEPLEMDLEEIEVVGLYTKNLGNNNIKIYTTIRATIWFEGFEYGNKRNDVISSDRTIYLQMIFKGQFKDNFKNIEVDDIVMSYNKEKFKLDESSTDAFIPYISKDNIEKYATQFLRALYPEALEKPIALPISEILNKLGLKAIEKNLPEGVFGSTYFFDSPEDRINAGTIVYDPNKSFIQGLGTVNNTIIHECVHWFFHKKYFDLMHLLNPNDNAVVCTTVEEDSRNPKRNTDNFKWMEWQANALAPRILMPLETTMAFYNKAYSKNLDEYGFDLWALERTIEEVANHFGVSKTSAKIRLFQLGIKDAYGISNYVDGRLIEPYRYKNNDIGISKTFHVDFKDVVRLLSSNITLRLALENKQIVYVDGVFVINNQKYVRNHENQGELRLTNYALNHMDECCLIFDIKRKYVTKFEDSYYSLCFMSKVDKDDLHYGELNENEEANVRVFQESLTFDEIHTVFKEADSFLKEHSDKEFTDFFNAILRYKNLDDKADYSISQLTLLDNKTINNYRNGKTKPDNIKKALALCAGLCLEPMISSELIDKCGLSLGNLRYELRSAIRVLIDCFWERGICFWNTQLETLGIPNATIP